MSLIIKVKHFKVTRKGILKNYFLGAMRCWLFNFWGALNLEEFYFLGYLTFVSDEHPCQINACISPLPPEKRELRSGEYQLSQVIKGEIALHIVSDNDLKFLNSTQLQHTFQKSIIQ